MPLVIVRSNALCRRAGESWQTAYAYGVSLIAATAS